MGFCCCRLLEDTVAVAMIAVSRTNVVEEAIGADERASWEIVVAKFCLSVACGWLECGSLLRPENIDARRSNDEMASFPGKDQHAAQPRIQPALTPVADDGPLPAHRFLHRRCQRLPAQHGASAPQPGARAGDAADGAEGAGGSRLSARGACPRHCQPSPDARRRRAGCCGTRCAHTSSCCSPIADTRTARHQ